MAATSGSILSRTAAMTESVLARSKFAIFLIDVRFVPFQMEDIVKVLHLCLVEEAYVVVSLLLIYLFIYYYYYFWVIRDGLQPLDLEVGKWLCKHAPGINTILVLNKSESLEAETGSLTVATPEAHVLGFGDPIAISAETGLGMVYLYEVLRPLLEDFMLQILKDKPTHNESSSEVDETKLPLQLAIVGRPNVGKSTLLNVLLQQERVMVWPEVGLTRDSIRTHIQFQGRTVYLVDTAGWLRKSWQRERTRILEYYAIKKKSHEGSCYCIGA